MNKNKTGIKTGHKTTAHNGSSNDTDIQKHTPSSDLKTGSNKQSAAIPGIKKKQEAFLQ